MDGHDIAMAVLKFAKEDAERADPTRPGWFSDRIADGLVTTGPSTVSTSSAAFSD